ncbi:hypothetical protein BOTBODRAFT_30414 [Botryobasidium botryosum FD-172 SS1]|uniref:C2H2-type domain-containing protein n=1 Tax=Botryobasidium botryosum (strain FD-172 SS1) TaxID=930990 RepID=A0A067MMM6_BOTB1|nr:hypothetical protein BOTBODRAFT_30414 [Botryobasidium botryosum FD-172 SS1]
MSKKWCPACLRPCANRSRLMRHLNDIHTRHMVHYCTECRYSTTQRSNLKTHRRKHEKQKSPLRVPAANVGGFSSATAAVVASKHSVSLSHRFRDRTLDAPSRRITGGDTFDYFHGSVKHMEVNNEWPGCYPSAQQDFAPSSWPLPPPGASDAPENKTPPIHSSLYRALLPNNRHRPYAHPPSRPAPGPCTRTAHPQHSRPMRDFIDADTSLFHPYQRHTRLDASAQEVMEYHRFIAPELLSSLSFVALSRLPFHFSPNEDGADHDTI